MRHISTKSNIMVADVELRFADVFQKPYFASNYAEEIRKANLLLLPSENIRENLEPVFPEYTTDFLWYLRENAGENITVDIAVDDENFHTLLLYSSFVALSTLLIREEILSETADLVVGFLHEMAVRNHRSEEEMDTFVNIIVESDVNCRKIMFSGRVSELKGALEQTMSQVFFPATTMNSINNAGDKEQNTADSSTPTTSDLETTTR